MKRLSVGDAAPDFSLPDHEGRQFSLSGLLTTRNVLLVFNLGFIWPHCTNHMAQLRHDYQKFQSFNTDVLVMVPNGPRLIAQYVHLNHTPYPILSDKGSLIAGQYGIKIRKAVLFTAMMPGVFLVNQAGRILYTNYLKSYIKEPDNREPLGVLAQLAAEQ